MTRRVMGGGDDRRAGDEGSVPSLVHRVMAWVFVQWEPVAGGRLFLLAAGAVTTLTAPLVGPGVRGYEVLAVVTAVMTAFLLASFVVPWTRMPPVATVVFAGVVWLAVATLGVGADGLGANFTGLFALSFAYLGLSQRTATTVTLLPVAAVCFVCAYGGWTTPVAPRLLIGVAVWLLLAVLIAELVRRQLILVTTLRHAAQTDALTGLGNRRNLDDGVALARPGDTVVICDLDHFKQLKRHPRSRSRGSGTRRIWGGPARVPARR